MSRHRPGAEKGASQWCQGRFCVPRNSGIVSLTPKQGDLEKLLSERALFAFGLRLRPAKPPMQSIQQRLDARLAAMDLARPHCGEGPLFWLGTHGGDHGVQNRATGEILLVDLITGRVARPLGSWEPRMFLK